MALIMALTEEAGVRIGALRAVASSLFEQSGRQSWAGFERSILIVELTNERAEFVAEGHTPQSNHVGIMVPCKRIVAALRESFLEDTQEAEQGALRFAPTIVRGGVA
ncbi:MAG: hypothetical protein QOJ58_2358 [Alphaproteobacteria bacterium]|nr:hypothetical protein [Alphaproteobacteria bacterium]